MTSSPPTALITGVSGQDGMYLARRLMAEGWRVVGTVRPGLSSIARMGPYLTGVQVVDHDLLDTTGFGDLLSRFSPRAVYNLAAFSAVGASWSDPELVARTNLVAVAEMLETLLRHRDKNSSDVRFFQASSAEVFGSRVQGALDEETPHRPRTPYAVAKSAAHHLVISYREHHDLFACNGILFNHESPFRGHQFVAGRIARAAATAACGGRAPVALGDLDVERDWGAAVDHVEAMRLSLAHDRPGDYVIATGTTHTLRDMLDAAFASVGRDDAEDHVEMMPHLWSATQADSLCGDPGRARRELGWSATTSFEDLIATMVAVDVRRITTGVAESESYLS
ncbi:putative GDP-mannose 4,6-dehydratase [Aeromicrobium marinum DSM 15272]|uniref:GDP-mannose 4,6-dehydratase n=1 Tax=Aeromicrobium marinum DSM 15272 TaxID=585531 RepID=E2SFH4_9ACTN|nr:GDP-mannose 4,6-dehydratase [Aeromicrobium marinum]EFQ82075.1 putative GDP-mannose 4,6-dehydratase [Aeromicrobium marinum DSM 15272]